MIKLDDWDRVMGFLVLGDVDVDVDVSADTSTVESWK